MGAFIINESSVLRAVFGPYPRKKIIAEFFGIAGDTAKGWWADGIPSLRTIELARRMQIEIARRQAELEAAREWCERIGGKVDD